MSSTLEVLFVDNHLLVVAKPAGLPTVPDASEDESLLDQGKQWIKATYDKPGAVFLGVVQRLDRPVSGVVLFARTSKAAARLTEAFRTRTVEKTYLAVGEGPVRADEGILEHWLLKDRSRNRVAVVPETTPEAKVARTAWRVLQRAESRVLFEFLPATGRSHQLRVAAKTLGAPLLGDLKYGAAEPLPDKSVALHAWRLGLEHPVRKEPLSWTCPVPSRAPWTGWSALR